MHNGTMNTFDKPEIGGHLLVQCLIAQGVTHAFGVPGESFLAVLDGFHRYRGRIEFIVNRQEGGAAFMAEAYGKLTRRPGVCLVTRAPGATNASIGVHTAFQDSTPMVLLVGDVASDMRDREAFQELNYLSFFGPSTQGMAKRVERIDQVERLPEAIARAFATAMNGRPGPVVLVLPEDMLAQPLSAEALQAPAHVLREVARVEGEIGLQRLSELREMLLKAKQPLVIAGGSGWYPQAAQALQAFAQGWQLPVCNAFRFQDTFDNHHPLYAGDVGLGINPALAARIRAADLILALGCRLGEITSGGYALIESPMPRQALIHVHPGADELNRVFQARLAIQCAMGPMAAALATLAAPVTPPAWADWAAACHADYLDNLQPSVPGAAVPHDAPGVSDLPGLVATLQRHLPADALLSNGAGNFAGWLHRYFRYHGLAKGAKTQLAPTNGAMGYGVPAGVAAAIVTGRTVLTLTGDGDFLMNGQELATAVQHGAKTIVVLLNNGMFGTIRMHQEREYPARSAGTALRNPDFCVLAQAFGYVGVRVERIEQFEPALLAALERAQGTLIEVIQAPQVISTRASLDQIQQAALARRHR